MDMTKIPTVFVAGATGTTGSALSRQLRDLGWSVNAITRDVNSRSAQSLRDIGVNLLQGDWDNHEVLEQQLRGVDMLFLLLSSFRFPGAESADADQAQNILRIARHEGVKQVVYMSAMGCDDLDSWGIDWDPSSPVTISLKSKHDIQNLVRSSDFPLGYTILHPGFYMANFLGGKAEVYTASGTWTTALRPETKLPMIDHEDIAKFVVAAFRDPERFRGAEISLYSELREPGVLVEMLSSATGKKFEVRFMSEQDVERNMDNPLVMAQVVMRQMVRFAGDGASGEKWGIDMTVFEEFLRREKQALSDTYAELGR